MSDSNSGKYQIGGDAKDLLLGKIKQAKKGGYIKSFLAPLEAGYPGHAPKQFKAPFLIEFKNGDRWILFSTTSLRDRVKEQQWDAENLKSIDSSITRAYLIYPDGRPEKEIKLFNSYNARIKSRTLYSALDGIYSLSEFVALLISVGAAGKSGGFIKNAEGRAFEVKVANSLKSKANLRILKGTTEDSIPADISILEAVLDKLKIEAKDVNYIFSSADDDDIGLLPSKGQPKTDVLANIYEDKGNSSTITISCKNTSAPYVTVGQHKADDIWAAVDPLNHRLRYLLNKFQSIGALSALDAKETKELTDILKPLMKTFCRFILGGINGPGDPIKHWAKYVMVCKGEPDDIVFYELDEFIDFLLSQPPKHYGTPFSWTYASKSKGSDIQFKVSV